MNDGRWTMDDGRWMTEDRKDLCVIDKLTPDEPSTPVMASHHFPISFAAWDIVMVGDVTAVNSCAIVSL
jgi:hypothetical protein